MDNTHTHAKTEREILSRLSNKNYCAFYFLVVAICVGGIDYFGEVAHYEVPPLCNFVDTKGNIIIPAKSITHGEELFDLRGIMSYVSYLGGSERGVDYTTDSLHQMAVAMNKYYENKISEKKGKLESIDTYAIKGTTTVPSISSTHNASNLATKTPASDPFKSASTPATKSPSKYGTNYAFLLFIIMLFPFKLIKTYTSKSLLFILILVLNILFVCTDTQSYPMYIFGFTTCSHDWCAEAYSNTMTLYWNGEMYQCLVNPKLLETKYECDQNKYIDCSSSDREPDFYGMQIDNLIKNGDNFGVQFLHLTVKNSINETVEYMWNTSSPGVDYVSVGANWTVLFSIDTDDTNLNFSSCKRCLKRKPATSPNCTTQNPTKDPSISPTNNPTNEPTRLPVQDPHKIYDAKIQITFRLTKLNNPQIDLFEANPLETISESIAIIESNYVVENEVLYEDFMIEIQKVNGFNIDNVYLKYGENITMISNILCKSDIANYLIYKSQNPIFEQHVTDDFKNYFAEQLQLTNKRILLQNDDDNELQFIVFNANKLQIEFNTPCSSDKSIIEFAVFGIVQIAVVIVILWFVIGYLIRFGVEETTMVFSVICCLLLAFMHGSVRSFIMTNIFVANAETILRLRCNELFWYQIYMLQLGEILLFIYLLSKMKSLNVFKIPMYYCLLLLISFTLLFSATMLSWFTIPIIKSGDCNNSELIICIDSKPSDVGIYKEYVAFLSVNIGTQCVLCFVFLYKFYQLCAQFGWDGTNKFTYRILSLGIFLVFLNLSEFIYFCITEETFHMIRFTIYSIIIIFSFKICAINEETGNSKWCCWCCMDDDNSIGTKGSLPQIDELNVLKEAESIGLI